VTHSRPDSLSASARAAAIRSLFGLGLFNDVRLEVQGDVLVVGWGSTKGAIDAAIERARRKGLKVSGVHLHYLNPMPPDLPEIFSGFKHLLVPELNNGQLVRILRERYLLPFIPLNKIKGLPFKASEIENKIYELLGH